MVFLFIFIFSICVPFVFVKIADSRQKKKDKEYTISCAKNNIKNEFESITHFLDKKTIDWLNDCADKLRIMSTDKDITDNVKPYDEFELDKLNKYSHDSFKIKVDKNFVPKFAPGDYYFFREKDKIDYELEACMDLKELESFIERCKMIFMNNEIEAHRKKIIENKLK